MRVAPVLTLLVAAVSSALAWEDEPFGGWKSSPARSTPADHQKIVAIRIGRHSRGEVFTLDTVAADGKATTVSTILYLDGKAREFQDSSCSGTQSSRRLDSRTVEILWNCSTGEWTRFVRRMSTGRELILEITTVKSSGRPVEQRVILEKQ